MEALSAEWNHRLFTARRSSSRGPRYSPRDRPSSSTTASTRVCPPTSTVQHPPAGTIDASETWRKIVPSHATTAGKQTRQTSAAAHVCTTPTGRLLVTDKFSMKQFLIDTGFDFCVLLPELILQRREHVNYGFCAANGTTIPTYRWLPPQPQPGTGPRVHVAVRGGRRHPPSQWSRLPAPLRPLG
jgi:hypothetical protein